MDTQECTTVLLDFDIIAILLCHTKGDCSSNGDLYMSNYYNAGRSSLVSNAGHIYCLYLCVPI